MSDIKQHTWLWVSVIFVGLILSACGGGGGSKDDVNQSGVKIGRFLDSAVDGLGAGTQSGITDSNGNFKYDNDAAVSFSIGDINIGSGTAKETMTPLNLVTGATDETNSTVTNITRFLITLDDDANPDNGITITQAIRNSAAGLSIDFAQPINIFELDTNVTDAIAKLTSQTSAGVRSLVAVDTAQSHLQTTLSTLIPTMYGNYTSGSITSILKNCADPGDNGSVTFSSVSLTITSQSGTRFSGSLRSEEKIGGFSVVAVQQLTGTVAIDGSLSGTFVDTFSVDGTVESGGNGTFTGQVGSDSITLALFGQDTYGDTCSYTSSTTLVRLFSQTEQRSEMIVRLYDTPINYISAKSHLGYSDTIGFGPIISTLLDSTWPTDQVDINLSVSLAGFKFTEGISNNTVIDLADPDASIKVAIGLVITNPSTGVVGEQPASEYYVLYAGYGSEIAALPGSAGTLVIKQFSPPSFVDENSDPSYYFTAYNYEIELKNAVIMRGGAIPSGDPFPSFVRIDYAHFYCQSTACI